MSLGIDTINYIPNTLLESLLVVINLTNFPQNTYNKKNSYGHDCKELDLIASITSFIEGFR